ncbi:MAG: GGDEF domain-containing protein [Rhodoferax sp.]|nr:GGDEF domain-containing protein [Rhodoferax sp.]MBP9930193.1 GGDEF domain-containing protein [Rhodoferax sp.]HQX57490.1 diguanylate cyclase [Burkholderiaceae bacterium]HQZ05066.1 diguanylate cyclase [Burkholderiaceae bacterium]
MADRNVPELARETLKQLIVRKLSPTPANYRDVFNEIARLPNDPPFPLEALRKIAQQLPARTPGQIKQKSLLEYAISHLNWQGVEDALVAYGGFTPRHNAENSGFTPLNGADGATAHAPEAAAAPAPGGARAGAPALTAEFLEQIARLIEFVRPALGTDDVRFTEQTNEMLRAMRDPGADVVRVKQMLGTFGHRVSFAAEDQVEIRTTLLHLLRLILENISELSLDDRWLQGQVEALMTATAPPLTLRRLDDVERRLRDVILKQAEAKGRALEAQDEMRQMLRVFIERLSVMTDSTDAYGAQMEANAGLIEQARSLAEITPVLKQVVSATRSMAQQSLSARNELRDMRERSQATEAEIAKLHQELDRVSAMARHDSLTGALNRKGLEEALNRELAVVRRNESALCVALLDIDNFKKINDERGHSTGDEALAHLAKVARNCMRPQDTLARYGGEEFVVLLPDTALENGIEAMVRLQRELTRQFFLAGTEKLLITFSAGVAQLAPDEEGEAALKRADKAMYMAKRAGKNRVLGA